MSNTDKATPENKPANFLRNIIERDVAQGSYAQRRYANTPGGASVQEQAALDNAKIRTRFPPEPNGYLHIGHAKSICINFGLAKEYGGICHMRFDDTNPEKEEQEYVDSILAAVRWLGFDWFADNGDAKGVDHLYHASDYFGFMYEAACALIKQGNAYIDEQTAEQMRANRGTLTEPGVDSPYRNRSVEDNLRLFDEMRQGKHAEGSMVLRAKIDMASGNINLRDPAIYRIRKATHHRTGDAWCIYPMYTFAHPIEDALEQITHSICTLEFEAQRPFYDWLLEKLIQAGLLLDPPPRQYEFARLNLTYIITSKRKLKQLVDEGHVTGWDDPRMPTIVGMRRRGYTPQGIALMVERTGVSKADSWIDYSVLEGAIRDDLEGKAPRAMAAMNPIKLVLTNVEPDFVEECSAPVHPQKPELGTRAFKFTRELWIDGEDFAKEPPKGYFRLFVGNSVRLKYGFVVTCIGYTTDEQGNVTEVQARLEPDSKSGTPGANNYKVKGTITWVSAQDAVKATVRLYDRLFTEPQPDAGGRDFLTVLNPESKREVLAYVEPALGNAKPEDHFQFERWGYFTADQKDHSSEHPVFNRTVGLKDTWAK